MPNRSAGRQLEGRELLDRQRAARAAGIRAGPAVLAVGLRLAENVGQVLRVADAGGAREVVVVSAWELNPRVLRRVSRNCDQTLNWRTALLEDALQSLPAPLVAVELTTTSTDLATTALPDPCTLVVGGEQDGVPAAVLERCQGAVHVPMFGSNGSMNVTHALAIALYEWSRQHRRGLPG